MSAFSATAASLRAGPDMQRTAPGICWVLRCGSENRGKGLSRKRRKMPGGRTPPPAIFSSTEDQLALHDREVAREGAEVAVVSALLELRRGEGHGIAFTAANQVGVRNDAVIPLRDVIVGDTG